MWLTIILAVNTAASIFFLRLSYAKQRNGVKRRVIPMNNARKEEDKCLKLGKLTIAKYVR